MFSSAGKDTIKIKNTTISGKQIGTKNVIVTKPLKKKRQ